MNYKPSYYNFIYDTLGTDKTIFFNSRTGALSIVNDECYQEYVNFIEAQKDIKNHDFFENLKKCGYIVPTEVDEKFLITTRLLQHRYGKDSLSLTIAPTMACNFRCIYCFEQGHYGDKVMNQETMENLITFFKKRAQGTKRVHVTWYGGEPLLGMTAIEKLSCEFIHYCEGNGIEYTSKVITNGYLYTKSVAKKLQSLKIQSVQITIDGLKEIHDMRRPLINGKGTFDTIIKNIIETKGILPIALRINVDENNINQADEIVGLLRKNGLLSSVYPYIAQVLPHNHSYEGDVCLSAEDYSRGHLEFILRNNLPLQRAYPQPKGNYCIADNDNGWVIDEQGNLYKCWNDIGILEYSTGNINRFPYLENTIQSAKYMMFNPINDSRCGDCKFAPICLGGCPHNRLEQRVMCMYTTDTIKDTIVEYVKTLLASKNL